MIFTAEKFLYFKTYFHKRDFNYSIIDDLEIFH